MYSTCTHVCISGHCKSCKGEAGQDFNPLLRPSAGKYGDGSDVTTWKINFRCALNGLKDIIERRELEEPDCRVYQMLPSTGIGTYCI